MTPQEMTQVTNMHVPHQDALPVATCGPQNWGLLPWNSLELGFLSYLWAMSRKFCLNHSTFDSDGASSSSATATNNTVKWSKVKQNGECRDVYISVVKWWCSWNVCVSFFWKHGIFFCTVFDLLLGIPNYFNSDSFTLGFRLGLTNLSFCSMCVLRFLYYLMCGFFL
jgi:hypothetical protein